MYFLLVVLGLAAVASATHECGPLQRLKVKHQWGYVYGSGGIHREELSRAVWLHLFDHAPKAKDYFGQVRGDNVYSSEFNAHMVRVMGGLDMSISLLTDDATLNAQLSHLKGQHIERGIAAEYFDHLGVAILDVVPKYLAKSVHFDQDAWSACYGVIASGIKN